MNPWIVIALIGAGIVFVLDFLLRRKKWAENTKKEKWSLLVGMISVGVYAFLSALAMLWGIVPYSPDTRLGEVLYDATLTLGLYYWVLAIAAIIGTFILRKIGKTKASIWLNVIALAYIAVVLGVNCLAGKFL